MIGDIADILPGGTDGRRDKRRRHQSREGCWSSLILRVDNGCRIGARGPMPSRTFRFHAKVHGTLAAWASLGIANADRADATIVFGRLELSFAFNLERDDLNIGHTLVLATVDLGADTAQSFIEEEGAAGVVAEKGDDRSIVPE
jgi:hypothetical protein